jgi:hypothetical protein
MRHRRIGHIPHPFTAHASSWRISLTYRLSKLSAFRCNRGSKRSTRLKVGSFKCAITDFNAANVSVFTTSTDTKLPTERNASVYMSEGHTASDTAPCKSPEQLFTSHSNIAVDGWIFVHNAEWALISFGNPAWYLIHKAHHNFSTLEVMEVKEVNRIHEERK